MPPKSEKQRKAAAIAKHSPGKLHKKNKGMTKMSQEKLGHLARKPPCR